MESSEMYLGSGNVRKCFRHPSKPVVLPKKDRYSQPVVFPTPRTSKNKETRQFLIVCFFWRKHIAVIRKGHIDLSLHIALQRQVTAVKAANKIPQICKWHVTCWHAMILQQLPMLLWFFTFWDLQRMDSSVFLTPLTVVPSIEVYHDSTVPV